MMEYIVEVRHIDHYRAMQVCIFVGQYVFTFRETGIFGIDLIADEGDTSLHFRNSFDFRVPK